MKSERYIYTGWHIEFKTPSIGIFCSNIVKSGLKSDASTQTITTCATAPQKSSYSVSITCRTRNMPELTLFPSSSQPVIIEYYTPQEMNSQASTHTIKNSSELSRKHSSPKKYPVHNLLTVVNG